MWTPGNEAVGMHLVMLSISDGTLRTRVALNIEVLGPRPWVRFALGGPTPDGDFLRFEGKAGCAQGRVHLVEVRLDNGPWVHADGTENWDVSVDMAALSPGRHRIEARSFDGSWSDVAGASFEVTPGMDGSNGMGLVPLSRWSYISLFIIVMVVIGGIIMLKTYNGTVFCVQRGPDGPTICVPVGTRPETAGGKCAGEEEAGDVPDQPSRNVRCIVCLGRMKHAEDYLECPRCGRVYHKACASRITACVMCGADLVKGDS